MKKLLFALALALPFTMNAQNTVVTEKDTQSDAVVIKGPCRFDDLKAQPSFTWMQDAAKYKPDAAAMEVLKKALPKYNLVVLFGSWCSDSQYQLPHLYKILQQAAMPLDRVALYGLDRAKKGLDMEGKIYNAERVPTIILFDGNKEIGRIIETPKQSLEKDLAAMIEG